MSVPARVPFPFLFMRPPRFPVAGLYWSKRDLLPPGAPAGASDTSNADMRCAAGELDLRLCFSVRRREAKGNFGQLWSVIIEAFWV